MLETIEVRGEIVASFCDLGSGYFGLSAMRMFSGVPQENSYQVENQAIELKALRSVL